RISGEISIYEKPPARRFRQLCSPIGQRCPRVDNCLQIVQQLERRRERVGAEVFGAQCFLESLTRRRKINSAKVFAIFFHPYWRKTQRRRCRETFDFAGFLKCRPMRRDFFTISNTQSGRCGACRGRTNKNRIVHMKSPAKKMPIAIRTPRWEKPIEPLRISARKPTAVVSAPKKTARPSFATDVAMAC